MDEFVAYRQQYDYQFRFNHQDYKSDAKIITDDVDLYKEDTATGIIPKQIQYNRAKPYK